MKIQIITFLIESEKIREENSKLKKELLDADRNLKVLLENFDELRKKYCPFPTNVRERARGILRKKRGTSEETQKIIEESR